MSKISGAAIEDTADIRESERELLLDAGYNVLEARNGLEGKRLLASSRERLIVLLDHLMPASMPALDACRLLELIAQDAVLRVRHTFVVLSVSPSVVRTQCATMLDEMRTPISPSNLFTAGIIAGRPRRRAVAAVRSLAAATIAVRLPSRRAFSTSNSVITLVARRLQHW